MCVKDGCEWKRRDMPPEGFAKALPYLQEVENVVLEGWGESLLYPDLLHVLRLVRNKGAEPGFVTSGKELDDDKARKIVAAGLAFIGFSFSGASAATHNGIRVNSDFDELVDTVRTVKRLQGEDGWPKVHIVYLMLKSNIGELPAMVELAHRLDVPEVVAINITQISNPRQDRDKAFSCSGRTPYGGIVHEALRLSRKLKINLVLPRLEAGSVAVCSENPLRNLYIAADGEVAPCVYLRPPVASPFPRIFCGEQSTVQQVSFGNIFQERLERIWDSDAYCDFRRRFEERERAWREVYSSLFEARLPRHVVLPEPPQPCSTCHKILGL